MWNAGTLKYSIITRFYRNSRAWTCARVCFIGSSRCVNSRQHVFRVHCEPRGCVWFDVTFAFFSDTTFSEHKHVFGHSAKNMKVQPKADLSAAVQKFSHSTSGVLEPLAKSRSHISQRLHRETNLPTRTESSCPRKYPLGRFINFARA